MGKKLLVADDSLTIQKVIRLALSNEGYDIQAVSDGNDIHQQIAVFNPDVILIDVSLPGRSAFDVKRETDSKTRFVLMSSAFEKVDEDQVEELKFDGRLTKPFDPAHLRQVLTDVLSKSDGSEAEDLGIDLTPDDFDKPLQPEGIPIIPGSDLDLDLDPPPPPSSHPEADIKHLTESTIKMSGFDDFQWSVNETAKKETSEPLYTEREPSLPPPPSFADLEFSDTPTSPKLDIIPPPPSDDHGNANVLPITDGQMEELLKRQLQDTLEKMAKRLLPEIAEKVIKQEIHKMLSEQL